MYPTKILNQHGQFHCHSWIPKAVLQLKIFYKIMRHIVYTSISDERGLSNWGFVTRNQYMKWVECKLNKAFLHFFAKCLCIFDDFSKFHSTFGTLYFEKSSNLPSNWQKMKKSLVQLAFSTCRIDFWSQKPNF